MRVLAGDIGGTNDRLAKRFGSHVRWEWVVSGPGLVNIHDFLIEYRHAQAPTEHCADLAKNDPRPGDRPGGDRRSLARPGTPLSWRPPVASIGLGLIHHRQKGAGRAFRAVQRPRGRWNR